MQANTPVEPTTRYDPNWEILFWRLVFLTLLTHYSPSAQAQEFAWQKAKDLIANAAGMPVFAIDESWIGGVRSVGRE